MHQQKNLTTSHSPDPSLSQLKLTLAKAVWASFISELGRVAATKAFVPRAAGVLRDGAAGGPEWENSRCGEPVVW